MKMIHRKNILVGFTNVQSKHPTKPDSLLNIYLILSCCHLWIYDILWTAYSVHHATVKLTEMKKSLVDIYVRLLNELTINKTRTRESEDSETHLRKKFNT